MMTSSRSEEFMRVLITSTLGLGHLLPVLEIGGLLTAAGHDVCIASPDEHVDRVRSAGIRHAPVDIPEPAEIDALAGDPGGASGIRELKIFGRLNPLAAMPGIERIIDEWGPDVVVSEAAEFGGGLAAARAGRPWVRVHPGAIHDWQWERIISTELGVVRAELGLPADRDLRWLLEPPQLCRIPAAFEANPDSPSVLRWRIGEPPAPLPLTDRAETVYITFGTEISGMPIFFELARASVAAAHEVGLHPILSVHQADPSVWADLGDVTVHRWVDQEAVMTGAKAVIFHGGAGTLLGALTAGTPALVVPLFADQPINAARLADLDAGLVEYPGPGLASRLAASLRRLVTEPRPACLSLAEAIRDLPGEQAAVQLIQQAAASPVC